MKYGLTDAEWTLLQKLVIEPLQHIGCRVWIFGSRARGNHQAFSDIDLLFELPSGKNLPPGFLSDIHESIEESRLSYKVDLVKLSDLAASYRPNVDREKIPL